MCGLLWWLWPWLDADVPICSRHVSSVGFGYSPLSYSGDDIICGGVLSRSQMIIKLIFAMFVRIVGVR